jgi:hypothetical protein
MASNNLLKRVLACMTKMEEETGKEPFLIYLGSADQSTLIAEIFQQNGLKAHVSPKEQFVVVEGRDGLTQDVCVRQANYAIIWAENDKVPKWADSLKLCLDTLRGAARRGTTTRTADTSAHRSGS